MLDTVSDLAAPKLEKEEALAKLLQSGAPEGRLLDREQVQAQWAQAFAALRDGALGTADRIVAQGANHSGEQLCSAVDGEVRDLLGV